MKTQHLLTLLLIFGSLIGYSQSREITGTVWDTDENAPVVGASVIIKGSSVGTITDVYGKFNLTVNTGDNELLVRFIGYKQMTVDISSGSSFEISLESDLINLTELVVIGSRNENRTALETPVPVDVINVAEIANNSPQISVTQLLNYVAPSFSSNTQTISDGTDHIDPASLRGLGPDQVLVLINGKRRHNSSLVNVNGTFGRGSVGTDLNAIPIAAIQRIEVLRDGAAAQYGSDAIAGVINIVLKDQVNQLDINATTGAYISENSEGNMDGEQVQLNMNYGLPIGKEGYINLTGNFDNRGYTNRMKEWEGTIFSGYNNPNYTGAPGDDITDSELTRRGLTRSDFNMRVGQSAVENAGLFLNSVVPLSSDAEFYAFGGINVRNGDAAGFYRLPNQNRTVTDVYSNGFLPEIHSNISDKSIAAGIRGSVNDWNIDFSNTFGTNSFNYNIQNTLNASLEASSPTSFDAGGFAFKQNTTNIDINRYWDNVFEGFNLAFGSEYRVENYSIAAGEEGSYKNYGLGSYVVSNTGDSTLIVDGAGPINTVFDPLGRPRPGGSQVFPGFSPANEVNAFRANVAAYVDVEADITESFFLTAALRYERYDDFGDTFNWKLAGRFAVSDNFALRGAASTGFRAPSLHQLNFNSTSTIFVDGVAFEVGTFSNDSRPAQLLGIPQLKQETSNNFSAGFTSTFGDFSLTTDGYIILISDRIVYTGQFSGNATGTASEQEIARLLQQANANQAAFFANAIDTKTTGLDVVLTHSARFGSQHTLRSTLAATFSQTLLDGDVKSSPLLVGKEDTYFDRSSKIYLEAATVRTKLNLTFNYTNKKFNAMLRNVYFGSVEEATNTEANAQTFDPKVVTDLTFGYQMNDVFKLSLGFNNLLDVYPDEAIAANQSDGRFLYSRRAQQFGINGRFGFVKLSIRL
ncbi:MAG: iron complex outermembrane receptor protein [Flavobacteriaceae bacterium]|jgi:iron complex outermembrane receptor protein